MSSSVNSDDVRPLVNSESLPSVSPVNLLGASSSLSVRTDNAHPRRANPPSARFVSPSAATNERATTDVDDERC